MSVIDKAEWQYDSALESYCEINRIGKNELTDEDERMVWNYASNHITMFVTWLAINRYLSDDHYEDEDEAKCIEDLVARKITGFDFFEQFLDLTLTSEDIREDDLVTISTYYENQYTGEYCDYVNALETPFRWEDYDKIAPVISEGTFLL